MGRNLFPAARWWVAVLSPLDRGRPSPSCPPTGIAASAASSVGPRRPPSGSRVPSPGSRPPRGLTGQPAASTARRLALCDSCFMHHRPLLGPGALSLLLSTPRPRPTVPETRSRGAPPVPRSLRPSPCRRYWRSLLSVPPGTPLLLGDSCPGPAPNISPAPCAGSGPLGVHLGPSGSHPPSTHASQPAGFPLGSHLPILPTFPRKGSSCRTPQPAYRQPSRRLAGRSASPVSLPLWQDSCCATWTVEERLPSFHPTATPKASTLLPSERTLMPGP